MRVSKKGWTQLLLHRGTMEVFGANPRHSKTNWLVKFREIPGAFTQAFNFGNLIEDDVDSDEEVKGLREGLVAVKFSKELKQRIRSPWYKALIVKVYGRSVGLNFLQNRLLSLWRPTGRLDCVDLSHGFFLTRFSLREDYEATLKRGPWFIGEHFLSIRPWEPDFLLATANVSSVAMWIRLNELSIEYYHAEALLQIGKAIGNVLRVDTHTRPLNLEGDLPGFAYRLKLRSSSLRPF